MSQGYEVGPAASPFDDQTSLLQTPPVMGHPATDTGAARVSAPPGPPSTFRSGKHPGERVQPEALRQHPVAYAALALSLIALLWLVVTSGSHDSYQRVRVGTQDCLSVPQDSGPAVLYCRANPAVK
jgi:hypothetical protein